jgi:hypothetical protein
MKRMRKPRPVNRPGLMVRHLSKVLMVSNTVVLMANSTVVDMARNKGDTAHNRGGMARNKEVMRSLPQSARVDTVSKAAMASSREDIVSPKEVMQGHHPAIPGKLGTHRSQAEDTGRLPLHGTSNHIHYLVRPKPVLRASSRR